ncbi:MAG: competence protein CoiA family protein [Cyanobacteria bacterium J06638_20]
MTLTAIDKNRKLYNPSAQIELGDDELLVVEDLREKSAEGLYCPHCYRLAQEWARVSFINPTERRKHFRHIESTDSDCVKASTESEEHLNGKAWAEEYFRRQAGVKDVLVEEPIFDPETGKKRKPDVLVQYHNGVEEGHEIQVSSIDLLTIKQRTQDLQAMGVIPVWHLKASTYKQEVRQWLWRNQIRAYLSRFDEVSMVVEDKLIDSPPQDTRKFGRSDRDYCSKRSPEGRYEQQVDRYRRSSGQSRIEAIENRQRIEELRQEYERSEEIDRFSKKIGASGHRDVPYSLALQNSGYELGSEHLLKTAIANRSYPMLGAWISSVGKPDGLEMVEALTEDERKRALSLWKFGMASDDINEMFKGWEAEDWNP